MRTPSQPSQQIAGQKYAKLCNHFRMFSMIELLDVLWSCSTVSHDLFCRASRPALAHGSVFDSPSLSGPNHPHHVPYIDQCSSTVKCQCVLVNLKGPTRFPCAVLQFIDIEENSCLYCGDNPTENKLKGCRR